MMKNLKKLIFAAFILLVVNSTSSYANNTNQETITNIFQNMLTDQKEAAELSDTNITYEDSLAVTDKGKYFQVSLPKMLISYPDGTNLKIGNIVVNVMPSTQTGHWKMSVALPKPILVLNEQMMPAVEINFTSQKFAGIWHEEFNNFIKLNAEYNEISIKDSIENHSISIPKLKIAFNLKQNDQEYWSGPLVIALKGTNLMLPEGAKAEIGEIAMKVNVEDYSFNKMNEFKDKIQALLLSESHNQNENVSWNHILALYNLVFEFILDVWNGYTVEFAMKDFITTRPPIIPGDKEGKIHIEHAGLGFGISGLRKSDVKLALSFKYNDFSVYPTPENFNSSTPSSMDLNLSLNNLPIKELIDLGHNSLKMIAESPQAIQLVGLNALMTAPEILTNASSMLKLNTVNFGNKTYSTEIDGQIIADVNATKAATGMINMSIKGLDPLIASINSDISTTESQDSLDEEGTEKLEQLKQLLSTLTMLQLMGQKEPTSEGNSHTFELNLDKAGVITLNGSDITPMLEAGQAN
jgi:hypothetical protein